MIESHVSNTLRRRANMESRCGRTVQPTSRCNYYTARCRLHGTSTTAFHTWHTKSARWHVQCVALKERMRIAPMLSVLQMRHPRTSLRRWNRSWRKSHIEKRQNTITVKCHLNVVIYCNNSRTVVQTTMTNDNDNESLPVFCARILTRILVLHLFYSAW